MDSVYRNNEVDLSKTDNDNNIVIVNEVNQVEDKVEKTSKQIFEST